MRVNVKIAICDDNKAELEQIKTIVQASISHKQSACHVAVHTFASGNDLFQFTKQHGAFDLVILDIVMPGLNGLELAAKLRMLGDNCMIIFLTGSREFAVESYKVNAYYYLLKNSAPSELTALLDRALDDISEKNNKSVVIKEKGRWTRVAQSSIRYVESVNHTVVFHRYRNETISCFGRLSEYMDACDNRFVRCHKSYIVNMQFVASITSKDFVLEDGTIVPISRNAYSQIKNAYLDYFFTKMK